jgi:hypothetical protein
MASSASIAPYRRTDVLPVIHGSMPITLDVGHRVGWKRKLVDQRGARTSNHDAVGRLHRSEIAATVDPFSVQCACLSRLDQASITLIETRAECFSRIRFGIDRQEIQLSRTINPWIV